MRAPRVRTTVAAVALLSLPLSGAASNLAHPARQVASASELVSAVRESDLDIVVTASLTELPTLRLSAWPDHKGCDTPAAVAPSVIFSESTEPCSSSRITPAPCVVTEVFEHLESHCR